MRVSSVTGTNLAWPNHKPSVLLRTYLRIHVYMIVRCPNKNPKVGARESTRKNLPAQVKVNSLYKIKGLCRRQRMDVTVSQLNYTQSKWWSNPTLRSTARSFNEQNTTPGAELLTTHATSERRKAAQTTNTQQNKRSKKFHTPLFDIHKRWYLLITIRFRTPPKAHFLAVRTRTSVNWTRDSWWTSRLRPRLMWRRGVW